MTSGAPVLVPLPADRRDDLLDVDQWAFAFDTEGVDPDVGTLGLEWDRTAGAEVDGRLVGVHSVYSHLMPVPGGEQVPTAGLTWVGVHPQFRRRGVLTAMMRHHLTSTHDAGSEPVSALWAAEPAIYGRFGYGLASRGMRLTLARRARLVDVPGSEDLVVRLERADAGKHAALVNEVFDRARADRPGMVSRLSEGLQHKALADPPAWRKGAETLRLLTVEAPGTGDVRGYALFRRKEEWADTGPCGTVQVREAVALDAAASRALWGRLTDLDLMTTVRTDSRPLDDPLVHQLVDLRAADARVSDALWVRLVDVPTALAARAYSGDVDVVLEVTDTSCPWNAGRWRLQAGAPDGTQPARGTCERTSAAADLRLDVRALASAYLGGETLSALAGAGLVTEVRPGTLAAASSAFSWHVAPYCGWTF